MAAGGMPGRRARTDQVLAVHLPADISLTDLVRRAKHRWIIERDYQELKQELGLGILKVVAGNRCGGFCARQAWPRPTGGGHRGTVRGGSGGPEWE